MKSSNFRKIVSLITPHSRSVNEKFVTFFKDDLEQKKKYVDEVWDMLQVAYKGIGGYKSCDDKEELMTKGDIWKLVFRGDVLTACKIYTSKQGGRKSIGAAAAHPPYHDIPVDESTLKIDTDGNYVDRKGNVISKDQAIENAQRDAVKNDLFMIIKEDIRMVDRHVWEEVSGAIEALMKKFGGKFLCVDVVKKVLANKHIEFIDPARPITDYHVSDKEAKSVPTDYKTHYARELGPDDAKELHRKSMVGNLPPEKIDTLSKEEIDSLNLTAAQKLELSDETINRIGDNREDLEVQAKLDKKMKNNR